MVSFLLNGSIIFQDVLAINIPFFIPKSNSEIELLFFFGPLMMAAFITFKAFQKVAMACFRFVYCAEVCALVCYIAAMATYIYMICAGIACCYWAGFLVLAKYSNWIAVFYLIPNALNIAFNLNGFQ